MRSFYRLTYREKKAVLKEQAVCWKASLSRVSYTDKQIEDKKAYFEKEGKYYGLLKEFKSMGII